MDRWKLYFDLDIAEKRGRTSENSWTLKETSKIVGGKSWPNGFQQVSVLFEIPTKPKEEQLIVPKIQTLNNGQELLRLKLNDFIPSFIDHLKGFFESTFRTSVTVLSWDNVLR